MAATAKENKVQFNLKNVHYAVLNEGSDGAVTYGTPVKVPGAVNLSLDPQGEVTPFYADGIVYYNSVANNGYSGDLEIARFHDQMRVDIWGMTITTDTKVLIENSNVEPKQFALLFQIDGDQDNDLFVLYNCVGTRPAIASTTNTETKEPQTASSTITASPLENGNVMARTTKDTEDTLRNSWFNTVYVKEGA